MKTYENQNIRKVLRKEIEIEIEKEKNYHTSQSRVLFSHTMKVETRPLHYLGIS
jgi:hypothetical protein